MSDISDLITTLRFVVEDSLISRIPGDIFSTGSSSVFTLTELNIASITAVLVNDIAISSSNYTYSSTTNKLTISSSLSSGDTVEIQYTYYANYSDTELEGFLRSAVVFLSTNNYYTFEVDTTDNFYPDITDREKNLLAMIASVLINKPISALRLPDMTLNFPETLNLHEKVSRIIAKFKHDTHGKFSLIQNVEETIWNPPPTIL